MPYCLFVFFFFFKHLLKFFFSSIFKWIKNNWPRFHTIFLFSFSFVNFTHLSYQSFFLILCYFLSSFSILPKIILIKQMLIGLYWIINIPGCPLGPKKNHYGVHQPMNLLPHKCLCERAISLSGKIVLWNRPVYLSPAIIPGNAIFKPVRPIAKPMKGKLYIHFSLKKTRWPSRTTQFWKNQQSCWHAPWLPARPYNCPRFFKIQLQFWVA